MKKTFDEMDQIEHDVTNALDGSQLSGLETSLETAFKTDIEVHVHVITITFYALCTTNAMMIGLRVAKQCNSFMHYKPYAIDRMNYQSNLKTDMVNKPC